MKHFSRSLGTIGLLLLLTRSPAGTQPQVEAGTWRNITPSSVTMTAANHVFCQGMAIDPSHPTTLYLCVCAYDVAKGGLYKSTG